MSDHDSPFELVTLRGGACSIRSKVHGETMHIGTGPTQEALELHVRQQRLVERVGEWSRPDPFVIWDIGLGPAGNAITAIEALRGAVSARGEAASVEIHSFEISTEVLEFALGHAAALGYLSGWEGVVARLLSEGIAHPVPGISWRLHRGDFSRAPISAPPPASVFFDPYSPARNPEMWSLETFRLIRHAVSASGAPDCVMTNYTRSTSVRVTMLLAGWRVGTGIPTGEKSETTIAANRPELLEKPLGGSWIARVRSSTNAMPIRGRNHERGPIDREDLALLERLDQFSGAGM